MKHIYTIERHSHGFLVKEPFPISCMAEMVALAGDGSVVDAGIANYHGAVLCFGQPGHLDKWRQEIEDSLKTFEPSEWRFMNGTGVGTSSATIVAALSSHLSSRFKALYYIGKFGADHPYDRGDFGRCHTLLRLRPDWVGRLGEVGLKFPKTKWVPLCLAWAELASLYEAGESKAAEFALMLNNCIGEQ